MVNKFSLSKVVVGYISLVVSVTSPLTVEGEMVVGSMDVGASDVDVLTMYGRKTIYGLN